ncbi:MAG: hypothetical protein WCX07_02780 [Dehalococcoidales bacterium]
MSGCTKTEYVTVTDTTTATTTLTTSMESQYSPMLYQAIIAYVMRNLEAKGSTDLVAGFVHSGDHMGLFFYGDANEEIVEFVKSAINGIAPPGLPLEVHENVNIVED